MYSLQTATKDLKYHQKEFEQLSNKNLVMKDFLVIVRKVIPETINLIDWYSHVIEYLDRNQIYQFCYVGCNIKCLKFNKLMQFYIILKNRSINAGDPPK